MATKAAKGKLGLTAKEINTPLLQALEFLCQTFGHEPDPWERRGYERTLAGINGDVLTEAAQNLVDQAAAGRKFYPLPKAPDWKAECAKVMAAKRKAVAAIHLESCDHSSHFVEVNGRQQRCPCWRRAQEAMAAVGQAIALPPSREDQMEIGS